MSVATAAIDLEIAKQNEVGQQEQAAALSEIPESEKALSQPEELKVSSQKHSQTSRGSRGSRKRKAVDLEAGQRALAAAPETVPEAAEPEAEEDQDEKRSKGE